MLLPVPVCVLLVLVYTSGQAGDCQAAGGLADRQHGQESKWADGLYRQVTIRVQEDWQIDNTAGGQAGDHIMPLYLVGRITITMRSSWLT